MSDYAIGDVQGCYDALQRLLQKLDFNERKDRLWFVGDLVNRGPQSLEVLRFIKNLPLKPRVTLGNHDLYLLSLMFADKVKRNKNHTLHEVLDAPDCEEIGAWLRQQSILYHDASLNVVMCHAGIAPMWDLRDAKKFAAELETMLRSDDFCDFLTHMYGDEPSRWSPELSGMKRLRVLCNYFTRMRYCLADGSLVFDYKGLFADRPAKLYPWFEVPNRVEIKPDIIFGHWAELLGQCSHPRIYATDTGCVWGNALTAICLQNKQLTVVD